MGRMDICMEVSAVSSYVAVPRYGHFLRVLHIFGYLKCHHATRLVFDPSYPEIDDEKFVKRDWNRLYGDDKETISINRPDNRGK